MTIDEAIKHAREVVEESREYIIDDCNLEPFEAHCNSQCIKCAEEHEQLAKWLEELKEYRIAFDLLLKDDCLNDKKWLGTLDELYEGRKEYYMNKAKEKIRQVE